MKYEIDTKIKSMIELQDKPIYRGTFLELKMRPKGNFVFKDFALGFLDDCRGGIFRDYEDPILKTAFENILLSEYERVSVFKSIRLNEGYAMDLFDELSDYIKREICSVNSVRIGDNWQGKMDFDIIGFFHSDMKRNYPRLLLNKKTKTKHLQPFVVAEVLDDKLYLNYHGKRIEEKL